MSENPGYDVDHLIVQRLLGEYDAWYYLGLERMPTLEEVMGHEEQGYVECEKRPSGAAWHLGRIRTLIREISSGGAAEPVGVDNRCWMGSILPEPIVTDGHHRLIAYALLGRETVPASYSGRVDVLRYLTGDRKEMPD